MMPRGWIIGAFSLALLSGCNTWQKYQASVEQGCREQSRGKSARYYDCLKKAAARDRERLRHQDEEWYDSIDDASQIPIIIVAPTRPPPHHRR